MTRVNYYFKTLATKVRVAEDRGMYRVAAYIKTAAKRSMRRRAGASSPGRPPHAHTGGGLRVISFWVDSDRRAAVIGPEKFSTSNFFNQPVTYIHEFGGVFLSLKGIHNYPQRSYMNYTLQKLIRSGKIPREFKVGMAKVI